MDYLSLLGAVAPVFAIIAAGLLLRRIGWLTAEADQSLLRIGVNFLYPCLIADTILGNPILVQADNLVVPPLVGFGTAVLGFGVCAMVARSLRLPATTERSFTFTTGLYNYGYLPIPLIQAFYDRDTLGVLFTHNLGVEIALWTVGVWILAPRGQGGWRNVVNVPILAIVSSVVLNLIGAHSWLPQFVHAAIHMTGQAAIPLALLLTGATLADLWASERAVSRLVPVVIANLLRCGILPVAFLLIAKYAPVSPALQQIIIIQAAMPSAMIPIILARHYQADSAHALHVVLSTTAVGLLTIPLWLKLGFWYVGR